MHEYDAGPAGQPPAEPTTETFPATDGSSAGSDAQAPKNNVTPLKAKMQERSKGAEHSRRGGRRPGHGGNQDGDSRPPVELPKGPKPNIELEPRDLALHIALSSQALIQRNQSAPDPLLYRRGDGVVKIGPAQHGSYIQRVNADLMLDALGDAAQWLHVTRDKDGEILSFTNDYPPKEVAKILAVSPIKELPVLQRLSLTPVYSSSGQLLTHGYDAESGIFVEAPPDLADLSAPTSVTEGDIVAAKQVILGEILPDFPFLGDHDRAIAVAAMLLPLVRSMIAGPTPLHLFEAPTEGTGKSILVEAVILAAQGQMPAAQSFTADEDEMRKRLATVLEFGHDVIFFDNLAGEVDSAVLSTALTLDEFLDRRLGSNTFIRHSLRNTIWVASGNNVILSKDVRRRTVRCRLDARMERPWERVLVHTYRHDPRTDPLHEWIRANRRDVLIALITLVEAWIQAGRPHGDPDKTLGSYERWSSVIGGILDVAGIEGFLTQQQRLYEDADSDETRWKILIEAWWDTYGPEPVDSGQLLGIVLQGDILPEVARMRDNDRAQRTKIGQLLHQRRDRVVSGMVVQEASQDPATRRQRYKLALVESEAETGTSDGNMF